MRTKIIDFNSYMNMVSKPLEFLPIHRNETQKVIALLWGLFIIPTTILSVVAALILVIIQ